MKLAIPEITEYRWFEKYHGGQQISVPRAKCSLCYRWFSLNHPLDHLKRDHGLNVISTTEVGGLFHAAVSCARKRLPLPESPQKGTTTSTTGESLEGAIGKQDGGATSVTEVVTTHNAHRAKASCKRPQTTSRRPKGLRNLTDSSHPGLSTACSQGTPQIYLEEIEKLAVAILSNQAAFVQPNQQSQGDPLEPLVLPELSGSSGFNRGVPQGVAGLHNGGGFKRERDEYKMSDGSMTTCASLYNSIDHDLDPSPLQGAIHTRKKKRHVWTAQTVSKPAHADDGSCMTVDRAFDQTVSPSSESLDGSLAQASFIDRSCRELLLRKEPDKPKQPNSGPDDKHSDNMTPTIQRQKQGDFRGGSDNCFASPSDLKALVLHESEQNRLAALLRSCSTSHSLDNFCQPSEPDHDRQVFPPTTTTTASLLSNRNLPRVSSASMASSCAAAVDFLHQLYHRSDKYRLQSSLLTQSLLFFNRRQSSIADELRCLSDCIDACVAHEKDLSEDLAITKSIRARLCNIQSYLVDQLSSEIPQLFSLMATIDPDTNDPKNHLRNDQDEAEASATSPTHVGEVGICERLDNGTWCDVIENQPPLRIDRQNQFPTQTLPLDDGTPLSTWCHLMDQACSMTQSTTPSGDSSSITSSVIDSSTTESSKTIRSLPTTFSSVHLSTTNSLSSDPTKELDVNDPSFGVHVISKLENVVSDVENGHKKTA